MEINGNKNIINLHSFNNETLEDDYQLNDNEKIKEIEYHFSKIMKTLGLDLTDDSLKDTPHRVAKMYVKEIFSGIDAKNKPKITLFDNKYAYNNMLVEKNITLFSNCEHHFVPIVGKVHVAYFPDGKVIGLSKINRLVQYYAKRPQVQERLTKEIADGLKEVLKTEDIAVYIEADHFCVMSRGVNDIQSSTITTEFSGKFIDNDTRNQFLATLK